MVNIMPRLEEITFTINKTEVLKSLKYFPQKTKIDSSVEKAIERAIDEGYISARPKAVYETFAVARVKEGYELVKAGYRLTGSILLKHLKQIEMVTLFACTIGEELEQRVKALIDEGRMTEATIIDAVAGEAVEGVANQVNEIIQREANLKKYKLRRRFSPGYGDWGIEEQKEVLRLIEAEKIGLSLTEACVMVPEKSISALIGWYK
jgi:cobalamin-dependent methionine synthase I